MWFSVNRGHYVKASIVNAAAAAVLFNAGPIGPRFERVYPLDPAEGVFAYARISPDGKTLAYASEYVEQTSAAPTRTIKVVQLSSRKILFTEPGIDAYWSNDGRRMIYRSQAGNSNLTIRHHDTGRLTRAIAPIDLGDYYSWGQRDGRNLILTILGNYFYLDGDRGVMPHARVPPCPGMDVSERPLISKDGRRITTFIRGSLVIRSLADCEFALDTGIRGAKADFSWDGRYVAFHAPKATLKGYDLKVVDTEMRTVRTITSTLAGSSLFPSWTKDGRLCFRYDGNDYRGFMFADHVLEAPAQALPQARPTVPARPRWSELFPETPQPPHRVGVVMIWAPWSAHSPEALVDLQRADVYCKKSDENVGVATALAIGSIRTDVDQIRRANGITLSEIPLAPHRFMATEAVNQIPTSLLFRDGAMIDRRLGAQSFDDLTAWIQRAFGVDVDRFNHPYVVGPAIFRNQSTSRNARSR
jgi:hypothetical protein